MPVNDAITSALYPDLGIFVWMFDANEKELPQLDPKLAGKCASAEDDGDHFGQLIKLHSDHAHLEEQACKLNRNARTSNSTYSVWQSTLIKETWLSYCQSGRSSKMHYADTAAISVGPALLSKTSFQPLTTRCMISPVNVGRKSSNEVLATLCLNLTG